MKPNLQRMIELITSFFDTRNDPDQISVSEEERKKLEQIHPDTLSELANEDGPQVWVLLIPTTDVIMKRFLTGSISEKQLLEETKPGDKYDTIYLCSAFVLPEFRRQGLTRKLTLQAIDRIRHDHPIRSLFYWPFSEEGKAAAKALAKQLDMSLYEKKD